MKRHLLTAWIISIFLTACASGEGGETTPIVSTEVPNTPLPVASATIEVEVLEGYDGEVSDVLQADIAAGRYDVQLNGLKGWAKYWAKMGLINSSTPIQPSFVEDQNKQGWACFEIDGQYWFPPLVNGKPAYEDVPLSNLLTENLYPLKVSKRITKADALAQNYDEKMAILLDGADFKLKGGQMVREKDNKIVAFIDKKTGRWVKELDLPIKTKRSEVDKKTDNVADNLENGVFLDFVKRNDQSGDFDMEKVEFIPLRYGINGAGTTIQWQWIESETSPDVRLADPLKRFNKRVAYAWKSIDDVNGYGFYVKVVKYASPSGKVTYLTMLDPNAITDNDTPKVGDFPMYELNSKDRDNDPETKKMLKNWVETLELDTGLEKVILEVCQ